MGRGRGRLGRRGVVASNNCCTFLCFFYNNTEKQFLSCFPRFVFIGMHLAISFNGAISFEVDEHFSIQPQN